MDGPFGGFPCHFYSSATWKIMEWLRSEFFSQFILNFSFHETKEKLHLNKKPAEEIISPHYLFSPYTTNSVRSLFFTYLFQLKKLLKRNICNVKILKNIKSSEKGQNRVSKKCFENLNMGKNTYVIKILLLIRLWV